MTERKPLSLDELARLWHETACADCGGGLDLRAALVAGFVVAAPLAYAALLIWIRAR